MDMVVTYILKTGLAEKSFLWCMWKKNRNGKFWFRKAFLALIRRHSLNETMMS